MFYSCQTEKKPDYKSTNENYIIPEPSEKELANLAREEEDRLRREEERKREEEIYERYIDNSLSTGSTTYSTSFGSNSNCYDYGCSQIKVTTPDNSDVLVTIKRKNKVVRHAYIKAADSYTFSFPNGE